MHITNEGCWLKRVASAPCMMMIGRHCHYLRQAERSRARRVVALGRTDAAPSHCMLPHQALHQIALGVRPGGATTSWVRGQAEPCMVVLMMAMCPRSAKKSGCRCAEDLFVCLCGTPCARRTTCICCVAFQPQIVQYTSVILEARPVGLRHCITCGHPPLRCSFVPPPACCRLAMHQVFC